jgi:hypothetical protein
MSQPDPPPVVVVDSRTSPGPRKAIGPALLFAVLSAFGAWGVGQVAVDRFTYTAATSGGMPTSEDVAAQHTAFAYSQAWTAAAVYAALGGLLAMSLGVLGGWSRSSPKAAIRCGLLGLVLGAAVAGGLATAIFPGYLRSYSPDGDDLTKPFLYYGGYWAAVGLIAGAVFGLGQGGGAPRVVRSALGGAIGGVLGAILFQVVGGVAFPLDKVVEPFPMEGITKATGVWSRLVGRLMIAVPIALGVTGLHAPPRPVVAPPVDRSQPDVV